MKPRKCFCYIAAALVLVWLGILILHSRIDSTMLTDAFSMSVGSGPSRQHLQPRLTFNLHQNDVINIDNEIPETNKEKADNIKDKDDVKEDSLEYAMIRSPEDQKKRDEGQRRYAFNLLVSDRLSLHRSIPDTRTEKCKSIVYPDDLPTASVVICFYNEAWSALLRTIYSVIDRTPERLLHEIIIVDDDSDKEFDHLGSPLEDYIKKKLPKVRLLRTPERQGLIRARVFGADHSTGEVLVFLDSHCEVNADWLQPMLAHIKASSHNVAIPIIDIINHDTFGYEASPLVRGGFNWGMHFRWDPIPPAIHNNRSTTDPIQSPTMAGGLFAIDRKYFNQVGKYDPGMDIWGGENLEISFRVWQCGGRLDITPCARVGHIFRKRRPYGSPNGEDTMTKNSLRVAKVWMDDYIEHYFKIRPEAKSKSYGDISERLKLRRDLRCKSFKWYLDNVYPEQTLPSDKQHAGFAKNSGPIKKSTSKVVRKGWLRHYVSGLCVISDTRPHDKRAMLKLANCDERDGNFMWYETSGHELLLTNLLCLDGEGEGTGRVFPRLMKCRGEGGSQGWKWTGKHQHLVFNQGTGKCVGVDEPKAGHYLSMEVCDGENKMLSFAVVPRRRKTRQLPPG